MAPAPITEDYYMVLAVVQTAPPELIIKSYKRLALKLHPDRNANHDATHAFQLVGQFFGARLTLMSTVKLCVPKIKHWKLGRAYETLKDGNRRQAYDLLYPSITRTRPSPQTTQIPHPPAASTPQAEALSEAAQIAALQRLKRDRGARLWTRKNAFDSSIFDLQRGIRRLEQEIKNLDSIEAAEAAEMAQKNSWGTWLWLPIYKKAEDSEEEKERKDREKQERRIEKDMKERRLEFKEADLKKEESLVMKAQEEVDAADLVDNGKIRVLQDRTWARETWERQEGQRVERERLALMRKREQEQQKKREQEAVEALRKQQVEKRAAEQKRREKPARKWREQHAHFNLPEGFPTADGSTRQAFTSTCRHDGWWPNVQGRTECPECRKVWTYLLQCPGCEMKACPRCQGAIRLDIPRNEARRNQRAPPRARTPSPHFSMTNLHYCMYCTEVWAKDAVRR